MTRLRPLPGPYLPVAVVAALCGVTPPTLLRWLRNGTGPNHAVSPRGRATVRAADLPAWLRRHGYAVPAEVEVVRKGGRRELVPLPGGGAVAGAVAGSVPSQGEPA